MTPNNNQTSKTPKQPRVALVFTPFWDAPCPPIGISYIKAAIKDVSECKVFDLNIRHGGKKGSLNPEKLAKEAPDMFRKDIEDILAFNPDIVGFSLFHLNYQTALYIMKMIKTLRPEIYTVIGGPHTSYVYEDLMKTFKFIDFCIVREGEDAFRTLIESIKSGHSIAHANIISQRKSIIDILVGSKPRQNQLVSVYPDFDDFNLDTYPVKMLPVMLTKGCSRDCNFCGLPNVFGGYRCRSPEDVLQEIKRDIKTYNVTNFMFTDALINSNITAIEELCDLIIKEGLDIKYAGEAFPDISAKLLYKLHKSGCRFLWISPETGSQRLMNEVFNKKVNIDRARETIINTSNIGINVSTWLMIGAPSETEDDLNQTIEFARSIKPYCVELVFIPFYIFIKSKMFREYKRFNIKELIRLGPFDIFYDYISESGGIYPFQKRVQLAEQLWNEFNRDQAFIFADGHNQDNKIYSYSTLFSDAFKK